MKTDLAKRVPLCRRRLFFPARSACAFVSFPRTSAKSVQSERFPPGFRFPAEPLYNL